MDIEQKIQAINNAGSITIRETQYFADVINDYFASGRPQEYSKFEQVLTPHIKEFCSFLDFNSLVGLLHNYFLFCRTNDPKKNNDLSQQQIAKDILQPFLYRIEELNRHLNIKKLTFEPNQKHIMLVTRHASTQGSYAPGKQIYTVTKALELSNFKVKIVSLGIIDDAFNQLMRKNPNIHVGKKENFTPIDLLYDLRAEIKQFEPRAILSDIELGTLTALELSGLSCPTCLLSAGFYRTPWYTKKLLTEELMLDEFSGSNEFVVIPQTLALETLTANYDITKVSEAKNQLKLEGKFVIGSFARYEMFSSEFLEVCKKILSSIPNAVLILAGPNDNSLAKQELQKFIENGRVRLLGVSDINILGNCCDVFLDTFPTVTGYAALESFAKGVPVFTRECINLKSYRKNRIEELIFASDDELINSLYITSENKMHYDRLSVLSKNFITKLLDLKQISKSILSQI